MAQILKDKEEPFTPELDEMMQELWQSRETAIGEHKTIVHVFEAILDYRKDEERFTPYYFEKEDRLAKQWLEIQKRVREMMVE